MSLPLLRGTRPARRPRSRGPRRRPLRRTPARIRPFPKSATDPSASADVPAPSWLSRAKRFVAGLVLQSGEVTRAAVLTRVRRGDRLTRSAIARQRLEHRHAHGDAISTCSRISDCAPSATASISTPRFIGPGMHDQRARLGVGELLLVEPEIAEIFLGAGTKAPLIRSRCRRSIMTMSASLSPVRMSRKTSTPIASTPAGSSVDGPTTRTLAPSLPRAGCSSAPPASEGCRRRSPP